MIKAFIFDLDGTLVQTERLKAHAYALAMTELCEGETTLEEVLDAFKDVVGLPRREVAISLLEKFNATEKARLKKEQFHVNTPWQAYVQIRMQYYQKMLADPQVIIDNQWSHNVMLLKEARENQCKIGLATMSTCQQTQKILDILKLHDAFHFVASRDDVENGKPDPEIYALVSKELAIPPENCLVIEDSPSGVKAALAAGMHCIAVTTPFTRSAIAKAALLETEWVVDDPKLLPKVVRQMIAMQEKQTARYK